MSLQDAFEARILAGALGLPRATQRLLAGRPVELDGLRLDVETQLALRLARLGGQPGLETLPIEAGRRLLDRQAAASGGHQPIGAVRHLDVAGRACRLYVPRGAVDTEQPLLVFFHGGGFIWGSLDSHDASCRLIAERAGIRVLAVDYRMAPEDPFPAAHDDALAVYRWVVEHPADVGADPARLLVGGDSAGGTLAASVALAAAREGLPLLLQVLVYPAVDAAHPTRSAELFRSGFYLTIEFMELANQLYFPGADLADPRVSPIHADVPAGLAPAYVATAGFDPLRDEGEAYAWKLADAGVEVELKRFPGQIHGFFNIVGVGRSARTCVEEIADTVRERIP